MLMEVSVILCTWNNSRRLAVTLDAIARCVVPGSVAWELVLVNNNCTDDTPTVVRSFEGRLPLVSVDEPRQGLSRARNTGRRAAHGKLILFTDDDITPCVGWIASYATAHREHPRGFYFGGPLVPEYEGDRPEPALLPLAAAPVAGLDFGSRPRVLKPNERFLGANWACPSDALDTVGEFDVRFGLDASLGRRRVGEEWDLMERLHTRGILPWYLPDAVVRHFVPAQKCRLPYLAGNWEAHGEATVVRGVTETTPFLRSRPELTFVCRDGWPRIAGAPLGAYVEAGRYGARWLVQRALGRSAYRDYASWRFCLGAISGHRQRLQLRAERDASPTSAIEGRP
jgi:glucosyl-dolichyl phosphate glucuronosyltransferase